MESVPQFEGGGPMVLVRNTFLDIEERPEACDIVRSKTAPPGSAAAWDLDDSDEEEEEDEQPTADAEASSPTSPDGEELEKEDGALCRTVTHEWLEEPVQWGWVPQDAGNVQMVGEQASEATASAGPSHPMPSYQAPTQPSEQLQMPQPQMPQIQQLPPQGGQMLQGQIPQGQLPQGQMPQGQMPMQMVLMPVAMAPMGQGAPCSGYAAPAPAPVPELPVRQPDRGARWPAAAPVPAGPMPQNTVTVTSATVPSPMPQGPPTVPQPQTLTRAFSVKSGFFRVHWTVDGRKLRGNEKQTVSPPFELSFGPKFPSVTPPWAATNRGDVDGRATCGSVADGHVAGHVMV
ncbi:unnamed protein product [Durusdinium trenchii]|uniref:Uncharacterized protein n=1 Tax=Durusdinium trenchii TaxID=1381693 RepID=A0ABP0RBM9_9DINO